MNRGTDKSNSSPPSTTSARPISNEWANKNPTDQTQTPSNEPAPPKEYRSSMEDLAQQWAAMNRDHDSPPPSSGVSPPTPATANTSSTTNVAGMEAAVASLDQESLEEVNEIQQAMGLPVTPLQKESLPDAEALQQTASRFQGHEMMKDLEKEYEKIRKRRRVCPFWQPVLYKRIIVALVYYYLSDGPFDE